MLSQTWILPVIGAWIVWGFWGFLPKYAVKHITPMDVIVWEVVGAIMIGVCSLAYMGFKLKFHSVGTPLGIAAGFCGYLGTIFFLHALREGPVSLVTAISALYPILTIVLAFFFLHEPLTLKQLVGIILAMVAVVLIAG